MVGLPTDTVYAMVADATRPSAVTRLYNMTGPHLRHQPIAVALDSLDQLSLYADLGTLERSMLGQLLPGRVTTVLRRKPGALPHLNNETDLLPIRIPGQKEKIFIRKVFWIYTESFCIFTGMVIELYFTSQIMDMAQIYWQVSWTSIYFPTNGHCVMLLFKVTASYLCYPLLVKRLIFFHMYHYYPSLFKTPSNVYSGLYWKIS